MTAILFEIEFKGGYRSVKIENFSNGNIACLFLT
jgi:hypothetical protein